MPEDRLSSVTSELSAYKWLIDEIADSARIDETADAIRKHGDHLRRNEADLPFEAKDQAQKDFMLSLSAEQKEVVIGMLADAQQTVAHDIAARLDECISLDEMRIKVKDFDLGESPFWSYHHDLICRLHNDPWPDEV